MNSDRNKQDLSLADQAATESARLVQSIGSGDREAEREFALRYLPRVRGMLLARSRNPDLSADLAQDVMIEAICALRRERLRDPSKLTAFVLAVARNTLNNHYRGAARQPESLEFPDALPDVTSMADTLETNQRETLAMEAIAGLDPVDKAILQMTLVDGLKPGVIAQKLGMDSNVVRQRKLRATRRVVEIVSGRSQSDSSNHFLERQKP